MTHVRHFFHWLFAMPDADRSLWSVIAWWELRRIPYNLLVGAVGIVSLAIFYVCIYSAHVLRPGDDAIEPLLLIFSPVAVNICYTVGWLVEGFIWLTGPGRRHAFGPLMFLLGLGFSLCVVMLPAIFWLGYRLLQLFGIEK